MIRLPAAYWPEWTVATLLSASGLAYGLVRWIDRDLAKHAVPKHLRKHPSLTARPW